MDATNSTQPPQLDVVGLVRTILGGAAQGLVDAASTSPLVAVLFALVAVSMIVRVVRATLYLGWRRDPVRLFTRTDKAAILARAGHRCEKHVLLFGRCRAVAKLEADHVHPWSRGGKTALPNAQALCQHHNRQKRASIPFGWQLRRLERRRTAYFPPGVPTTVDRRAQRAPGSVAEPA